VFSIPWTVRLLSSPPCLLSSTDYRRVDFSTSCVLNPLRFFRPCPQLVLWRFHAKVSEERIERRATRIAGASRFLLAADVVAASVLCLTGFREPRATVTGIAILAAAAAAAGIMPWLANEKRPMSAVTAVTGSAALRADTTESALCAYLSLIALIGLLVGTRRIPLGGSDGGVSHGAIHHLGRSRSTARQEWLFLSAHFLSARADPPYR
jgi:hypothetical protein